MADPASTRIYRQLREQIVSGVLAPGARVPSAREIVRTWGVAIATASKALARLRDDGLVTARRGAGTTVAARKPPPAPAAGHELRAERIVAAAIALADRGGLAAVSMRTIAGELGTATMSLYRHVASRDQLIERMVDAAFAELTLPAAMHGGWRPRLERFARGLWQLFVRHPWLPHAMSIARPQLTPSGMAHTEWALAALADTGLDLASKIRTTIALVAHARAHALDLERERNAYQDSGMTVDEWFAAHADTLDRITMRRMPMLAQVAAAADLALDPETLFGFGLERLLDGVFALIGGATSRGPAR